MLNTHKVHFTPTKLPMNFSGKLTAKIVIKDDYIRADGTCPFMQIFLNGKEKASAAHIISTFRF
jgi:hypothetical protein